MEREYMRYSEAFKRQVIQDLESGKLRSFGHVRRVYDIRGSTTVERWVKKYGSEAIQPKIIRVETMKERDELKEARKRIRELEAVVSHSTTIKSNRSCMTNVSAETEGKEYVMKRIAIFSICALLACPAIVLAEGGAIRSTEIAFPEEVPTKQAHAVLKYFEEKTEFKNGTFINEYTWCRYAAPTAVLADLVKILSSKGQLSVTVTFAKMKEKDIAFVTSQSGNKSISLAINLDYKDLELNKLTMTIEPSPRAYSSKATNAPTEAAQK